MREFWLCVTRVIWRQTEISTSLNESFARKMLRASWTCVYLLRAIWIGVKTMRTEVIGETVLYRGKRCSVNNWANTYYPSLVWSGGIAERCDRAEITTLKTLGTFKHRFLSGFFWWTTSWLEIYVHQKIYK